MRQVKENKNSYFISYLVSMVLRHTTIYHTILYYVSPCLPLTFIHSDSTWMISNRKHSIAQYGIAAYRDEMIYEGENTCGREMRR